MSEQAYEKQARTISVASTLVPTIFKRILVPFWMTSWACTRGVVSRDAWARRKERRTVSSELEKHGGFEFGSKLKSGGTSCGRARASLVLLRAHGHVEQSVTHVGGDEALQRADVDKDAHLRARRKSAWGLGKRGDARDAPC